MVPQAARNGCPEILDYDEIGTTSVFWFLVFFQSCPSSSTKSFPNIGLSALANPENVNHGHHIHEQFRGFATFLTRASGYSCLGNWTKSGFLCRSNHHLVFNYCSKESVQCLFEILGP